MSPEKTASHISEEQRARNEAIWRQRWTDWTHEFRDEWVRLEKGRACPFQTADAAYHLWLTYRDQDAATIAGKVWSGEIEYPDLPPPD